MPRILKHPARLLLVLVFTAALAALLVDTQSVAARLAAPKQTAGEDLVIAQLSDTHIGLKSAPEASANLRRAVEMINQHGVNVDAVIVTGDVGERPEAWDEARDILKSLKAKVYYVPGNHDVHTNDVERWRQRMGKDYDKITIKNVTIFALDSQLLGNYDNFSAREVQPLPAETKAESDKMLGWFAKEIEDEKREAAEPGRKLVFAMQHVPISRAGGFPDDPKPYWTVQEPYRSRELDLLHQLGVKHMFVGHWHKGMVYDADGITYHVGPATSWSPFGAPLGFAIHTIKPDGEVKTEFVYLQ